MQDARRVQRVCGGVGEHAVVVSAVARCTVLVDGGSRLKRSEAAR